MILQARGRVTAPALADECEVSLRTIYRDIDALSASGVPVYADRGAAGGYRLLDGYRTRLNGVSPQEAEALFLAGLPGPADALGLGANLAAAQLKLVTALPPALRPGVDRMRARFHLDAPGWFNHDETPAHLRSVFEAVWWDRPLQIRYRSWKAEKWRRLAPLGLVLKAGTWYLVGAIDGDIRTYHIGRIRELVVLDETFDRPPGFDLAAHWAQSTRRVEEELHPRRAIVKLSATGVKAAQALFSPYVRAKMELGPEQADGSRIATVPVGSDWHTCSDLLRFGPEIEILDPPALRAHMIETIEKLRELYGPQQG